MWLDEPDSTSYVLLISVLIILGVFALMVFGSLPCGCKFINYCCRNKIRVADSMASNRVHVIDAGIPEPESLVRYPVYPFATEPVHLHGHGQHPMIVMRVTGDMNQQLPCYYEYRNNQSKFPPCIWDEPPPPYDALFPSMTMGTYPTMNQASSVDDGVNGKPTSSSQ